MPVVTNNQLTLDFDPGLSERHPSLLACVREAALTHRSPLKTIAADMDLSQSELSRKLGDNPNDPRQFTVNDLEAFIKATGDVSTVYYLVEKYLQDDEQKQKRALSALIKKMPDILALLKAAA